MTKDKNGQFADQMSVTIGSEVTVIGGATSAETIAEMAATKHIALSGSLASFREGDQIEWRATLQGRLTVTKAILEAAMNHWIR
jgi:hypothetical protein